MLGLIRSSCGGAGPGFSARVIIRRWEKPKGRHSGRKAYSVERRAERDALGPAFLANA